MIGALYERHILSRCIDFAMGLADLADLRARHVSQASGRVLEVGIGSGRNLPCYTRQVTSLFGIDPSPALLTMARARLASTSCPVELCEASAERIPLKDASVDTAVTTWTLCSVADPRAVLREIRRVLTPAGVLIFVEHGLAPEAAVARWQHRVTPVWRHVAGGCHLDRRVDAEIRGAGFTVDSLDTFHVAGPRILTYMYAGRAMLATGL